MGEHRAVVRFRISPTSGRKGRAFGFSLPYPSQAHRAGQKTSGPSRSRAYPSGKGVIPALGTVTSEARSMRMPPTMAGITRLCKR